jgi:endoglycosylceramidase
MTFAAVLTLAGLTAFARAAGPVRGDGLEAPRPFEVGAAAAIVRDGSWLRDAEGRFLILRGVNLASRSKRPPYLPVLPVETRVLSPAAVSRELERLQPELRRLTAAGVNVVRLLVMWKAIEPVYQERYESLQPAGAAYLAAVHQVVDALYAHGILVIIDFHQDIASEAYGGDGFPDWAIAIDRDHPRPQVDPKPALWWGTRYFPLRGDVLTKGVRHTLQSFWRDAVTNEDAGLVAVPAQSHLVRTIGLTASFFRGHPAILGYEPFNEPHQAGLPKMAFERETLARFYGAVIREVARADAQAFVFVEPRLDWTTYPADDAEPTLLRPWSTVAFTDDPRTFLDAGAWPRDARVIVSFHYYDPALVAGLPFAGRLARRARAWPAFFAAMDAAIRSQGAVPFLTEFGCDQGWTKASDVRPDLYGTVARACVDLQYREVDANLWSATYWNVDFYSRRGADGRAHENWNEENLSLLGPEGPRNLDVASRPYPMRSSARPVRLRFDLASRQAAFAMQGAPVAAPTVVFVPARTHYAGRGFEVRATTSRAPVWDAARGLLYWWPRPGDGTHALVIAPRGGFDAGALPPSVQALLPAMSTSSFAAE